MPSVSAIEMVRVLVFLFSFIGIIGSISSIIEQKRYIPPEGYSNMTEGQVITASRMLTREVERILMFGFFIIAATSNIIRGAVSAGEIRDASAMLVLFSLLAVNFVLMLGTLRDRKKTAALKEIIRKQREEEETNKHKYGWLVRERIKDGNA